jgi:hypothetical protein
VHEEFLVKAGRSMTVPRCGAESALEISIESLDIPAHVIQPGEFGGGIQGRVQKRGDQAAPAKTVAVDKEHTDRESFPGVRVHDPAKIVYRAERTEHLRSQSDLGGNDEMSFAGQDPDEGCAVAETVIQENQVALPEAFDELADQLRARAKITSHSAAAFPLRDSAERLA